MRVADICPTCATYVNAACVIYAGEILSTIEIPPLTSLDEILLAINNTFKALEGTGVPSVVPKFKGQLYIDNSSQFLYIGMGTTSPNWGLIGAIATTTTTTSTSTTTAP